MDGMQYWIWLSLAITPGGNSFKKLIADFGSAEAIYKAEESDIAASVGSRCRDFTALCDKNLDKARQIYDFCKSKSVGLLAFDDENYPSSLKQIPNPPPLLYYRGILPDFESKCFIAVVGTRRLTSYGRKNAFSIAHDLARCGFAVVSGMAVGVDGVAMAAALSADGAVVGVLGCGIDICYPSEHLTLARETVRCGCILTEYAPGVKPNRYNFPRRNRIISGLCAATVVIEGHIKSGSVITARCAKLQNRGIYALPGNVDNKTSEVTNLLIKNGAKLITDATDIVKDFEYSYLGRINPFAMADVAAVNTTEVLQRYGVSCVTPSDGIFSTRRGGAKAEKENKDFGAYTPECEQKSPSPKSRELSEADVGFDKNALEIYKKISEDGECPVESLTEGGLDMRTVMRALLKLEMGGFIEILPGEKVAVKESN